MAGHRPSTDFLAQLAGRALGQRPAIVPRLPALFEPRFGEGDFDDHRDPEGPSFAEPTVERPDEVKALAETAVARVHIANGPPPSPEVVALAARVGTPLNEAAPLAERPRSRPAEMGEFSRTRPERIDSPAVRTVERARPPNRDKRAELAPPKPERADWRRNAVAPAALAEPTETGAVPLAIGSPRTDAELSIAARAALRSSDDRAYQMPGGPGPATEPTINVTIGRIEVRAAVAPAPPPAQALPRRDPPQSLGDYLRAREQAR